MKGNKRVIFPQPKVSVIVCCYNHGSFLREAIESILNQTHPNMELVVIDNGSTDDSREVMNQYADDDRVKLIFHAKNVAITKRLNEGIRVSTGDYISILYADDYYLPSKTEEQLKCFETLGRDYGVVYSPGYRENAATGERWLRKTVSDSGFVLRSLLLKNYSHGPINPISPLVRRECHERYSYDEGSFAEGEAILLKIAMSFKFKYLGSPLVVMRDHDSNIGKVFKRNREEGLYLLGKLLRAKELPADARSLVKLYMARALRNYGWQAVRLIQDTRWARESFWMAVRWHWSQAFHPRTIAGLVLSVLPPSVLKWFNQRIARVKNSSVDVHYVDAYT